MSIYRPLSGTEPKKIKGKQGIFDRKSWIFNVDNAVLPGTVSCEENGTRNGT